MKHFLAPLLLLGIYAVFLYLAIAYWALKDARYRSQSVAFHLFALGLNMLVPLLGLLIYLLVRPSTTLADERALALEEEALTGPVEENLVRPCPSCGREIERDYVLCPYCHTRFARRCPTCRNAVRLGWALCPFCATTLDHGAIHAASESA
ncbi:MAG: zinc ribbon domain-containing protein [Candidatus Dormibacteria bacterium]